MSGSARHVPVGSALRVTVGVAIAALVCGNVSSAVASSADGPSSATSRSAHASRDWTTTSNNVYLFKAASGRILRTLVQGTEFAQCVYANNWLFSADNNGVYAWRLK